MDVNLKLRVVLTAQEYKLGENLVQGLSLRLAAKSLGMSYETARDKLKIIYQKTGVNSQVQLALLIDRHNRALQSSSQTGFNGDSNGNHPKN